jgi:hypothetical protein
MTAAANFQATATRGAMIRWDLTDKEPEGEWVNASEFPNKTLMIEGGQATLYGCMDKEGDEFELHDVHDYPIKSPGMCAITLNPRFIRPVLVALTEQRSAVTVTVLGSR